MKNLIIILITLFTAGSSFWDSDAKTVDYDYIIQNAKIFDGEVCIENATLFITDSIITEIVKGPIHLTGNNVIDATGYTLMPGLINAHVHAWEKSHSQEAAMSGVLTLLDQLNNKPTTIDTLKFLGNSAGPFANYYTAGYSITVPNGHGTQFGKVPTITKTEQIKPFIEQRVRDGSDWIKIIVEEGHSGEHMPTISDEMLKESIDVTAELNMISIAHVSSRADGLKAVRYGVDGLAHIWGKDSIDISDSEISVFKNNDVFIIPTLVLLDKAKQFVSVINIDLIKRDIKKLHEAGVPILTGTDSPNLNINFGSSIFDEMELLQSAGLSNLDVLKSATSNITNAFDLKQHGYIKKGYKADLILIDGDPTTQISDIRNVSKIWKKGELINVEDRDENDLITEKPEK